MWLHVLAALLGQTPGVDLETTTPARELVAHTRPEEYVEQLLDDGRHQRFGTAQGPVHVWRPRSYQASSAATVVYVHGFYTDVDRAMEEHRLTQQFRDSGRNALFIVPEARSWRSDPVFWPDLEELLTTVERRLKLKRPKGPLVVVGHSGAYKTIVGWLGHPKLAQVILVDGLYGNDDDYRGWISDGHEAATPRQLVLVGFDTQQRAEWFAKRHGQTVRLDTLPWLYDELPASVRKAPVLAVQSERLDHMQLVTSGRLLPWLLHALR
ncbi:MAG: hypothetical protein AB1938_06475 [Myxococcota bacterium]